MQSTMTLRVEVDWKGESHSYEADVILPLYIADLDAFLASLPTHIARKYQMHTNTPEFDWLASSPMQVIAFKSRIESEMPNLPLDVAVFLDAYQALGTQAYLKKIAQAYDLDLKANPCLDKALKAAYTLGREHRLIEEKNALRAWLPRGFT